MGLFRKKQWISPFMKAFGDDDPGEDKHAAMLGSRCHESVIRYGAVCGIRTGTACNLRAGQKCKPNRIGLSCRDRFGNQCYGRIGQNCKDRTGILCRPAPDRLGSHCK